MQAAPALTPANALVAGLQALEELANKTAASKQSESLVGVIAAGSGQKLSADRFVAEICAPKILNLYEAVQLDVLKHLQRELELQHRCLHARVLSCRGFFWDLHCGTPELFAIVVRFAACSRASRSRMSCLFRCRPCPQRHAPLARAGAGPRRR